MGEYQSLLFSLRFLYMLTCCPDSFWKVQMLTIDKIVHFECSSVLHILMDCNTFMQLLSLNVLKEKL